MLKKFILIGLMVLTGSNLVFAKNSKSSSRNKLRRVILQKKNTLILREVVNEQSVKNIQQKLLTMSNNLSSSETIFLYLRSPGGSVEDGESLIQSLQAIPQKVVTITDFSASMAAVIAESLNKRLVLQHGNFMFHRMSGSADGKIPGELTSRVSFYLKMVDELDKKIADRLGVSVEKYRDLEKNEYWTRGEASVKEGVADEVVLVSCGNDMVDSYEETLQTLFGEVNVMWSSCPLISAPLSIHLPDMNSNTMNQYEVEKSKKVIFDVLMDPQSVIEDRSLMTEYLKYVK